ncbi:PfkB family carbohydrate kinase [Marivita sp.]|uniref:PfkB family carbohydrate kinase n=1 Tax=Marivita sp. TaxID=2003365 RepID=UPI003F6FD580
MGRHSPETVAQIVDTTAAGDSFNAGYLAGRIMWQGSDQAIRSADQLTAHVVSHHGALVL